MINTVSKEKISKSKVLSVFDFDGTLTYHDGFIAFLRFAFSQAYFVSHLMHMITPALRYMWYGLTRDELKEALIKTFLTNVNEHWVRQKAKVFCEKKWTELMRPSGVLAVSSEVNSGAEVTICSASPELILQPFADKLNIKVIGTQLEVTNGKLTGRIANFNCRCAQKIVRLEQVYGNLNDYYLRAWGDTRGDYELLSVAQDPHWRYFHKTRTHPL